MRFKFQRIFFYSHPPMAQSPQRLCGGGRRSNEETIMAKGQQRGNREQKKPKQVKAKSAPVAADDPKSSRPKVVFGKRGLVNGKS